MRMAISFGVLVVGLLGLTALAMAAEHTKDSLDTVKKAVADDKAVLLDVREKSEWDDGHLKDAKLLPLSVLNAGAKAEDVAKIAPKDKIIYCHCRSGVRSLKAADELKKLGYDVRPLKAGYTDLLKTGFAPAPQGKGGGFGKDAAHKTDMELFHFLLDNRKEITRKVTNLPNGIETLTESDNPKVVEKLQAHVESMYKRVEEKRPIHARDPLFAEIFRNADKIKMKLEKTKKGVKVIETSEDAYTAKLIQAHAEVVNLFIKNGRAEMMKNHALPDKK